MKVGLDWDGTVSLDPIAFRGVVTAFLNCGHEVAVVTWRVPAGGSDSWMDLEEVFAMWGFRLPVIYCSGEAKRDHYPADIWIEDNPAAVIFGLSREPRFVENAADYDEDVMVCENRFGKLVTTWKLLNPDYRKVGYEQRPLEASVSS